MTAEIEGKQKPLSEVFGGDYVYKIPLYQRPYAWTKENVGLLYDDLMTAIGDEGTPVDDLDPYFLGSVVLIKEHGKPTSDVVDGQQRLTTLSILLAALRETVQEGKDDLTGWLFVTGNKFTKTEAQYRLTLREQDAVFFRAHVQEPSGFTKLRALDPAHLDEPQQRIRENALLLADKLVSLDEPERQRLAEFMMRRCYLIVVSTPNLKAAFRIFSVLNDRGLDLSHTDILKAEVIGGISDAKRPGYAKLWEELETELGREAFEDVFAHVRTVFKKTKPRGTILEEFREAVKPSEKPEAFLDQVLSPLSAAYLTIRDAAYEKLHRRRCGEPPASTVEPCRQRRLDASCYALPLAQAADTSPTCRISFRARAPGRDDDDRPGERESAHRTLWEGDGGAREGPCAVRTRLTRPCR